MPTIAPEPGPPSDPQLHRDRRMAESFGTDAERYDRARPSYPDAVIERIAAACPGPELLDVGCGTGIAARRFQAAGRTVLGVEPDARMAELARRLGTDVEVATIEDWDPAGRTFDGVVSGQAWHWVDPVAGAAKAARVLRPGGVLAAFWNAPRPPPEIVDALAEAVRRVVPDIPVDVTAMKRPIEETYPALIGKVADGVRAAGAFGPLDEWPHEWTRPYTRDEWLDQLPTAGVFTRLAPDRLAEVAELTGQAIDRLGGGFTMAYTTLVVMASRVEGGAERG
ncbi:class I SAM-dependent methyltransferase [Actinomadura syzygii]|uniref:Class I SAM-dependent methyltransferase n=1 Tax=Actinomadura syzygii TaxID=1427538 RepID=A0A5D0UFH2_9ACTN|nr:class I SAM-dependent methyltransferase [Actinomadura syzygii]TYC16837.1 class I SAM-dependent methyltransferase [Actinomadura syzygii]